LTAFPAPPPSSGVGSEAALLLAELPTLAGRVLPLPLIFVLMTKNSQFAKTTFGSSTNHLFGQTCDHDS
jgi:hypothetical protein